MSVLLFIVAIAVFIVVIFTVIEENRQRLIITGVFAAVMAVAGIYTYVNSAKTEKKAEMVRAFDQNKTIICNGVEVNQGNFYYDYPTQSFIGTGEYRGQVISLSRCKSIQ